MTQERRDLFERTIPEVLVRTASRMPQKDAFICGDDRLSYADTVRRMRQLAACLIQLGVKRGDRIALYLNQSLESAVAIYGVMYAGAAFVPIDPNTPIDRMRTILQKCSVRHIITHEPNRQDLIAYLAEDSNIDAVIGVSDIEGATSISWQEVAQADPVDGPIITSQDLSYIMWTSGSTGQPKGMTHVHRNGLIYAGMLAETHELGEGDRFLGLSPLHFDMCVMDYIAAPMVGGTTIIVPESVAKLPAALTRLAAHQKATICYTVPFAMTQMLSHGGMDAYDLTSLRWMIFGGENFPAKQLRALMDKLPNAKFANAFGPAETHQISSYTITSPPQDGEMISVGAPWRTLEAIIVDDDDGPVAQGEAGELLVRSPSCMLGYWKDPERTDEAFYRRKSGDAPDQIFYRTGDLVRQDTEGLMFFLGRKGRQIKLRGYRIELDEVEAVLSAIVGVQECAVIADASRTHLIGFVLSETGAALDPNALIDACKGQLPPQSVPKSVQVLAEFPRTGSGKIDRKALLT